MVNLKMTLVAGIPLLDRKPEDVEKLKQFLTESNRQNRFGPKEFELRTMPKMKCYVINHTGPYKHLGNAWARGITMVRNGELKVDRRHACFELYLTHPKLVKNEDFDTKTALYFPVSVQDKVPSRVEEDELTRFF